MSELAKELATMLLVRNKDGDFVEYKEPFATIECETEDDLKQIQEAMRQYKGWIPIEEALPDPDEHILVSFENFSIPMIGRYTVDDDDSGTFRIGDVDETFIENDLYVNAWMPLPESYRHVPEHERGCND